MNAFWQHVDKSGGPDACWPWLGSTRGKFYGQCDACYHMSRYAHIAAWCFANRRKVPKGMVVRHSCATKRCCNPRHLMVGTSLQNTTDSYEMYRDGIGRYGRAKLTVRKVELIREMHRFGHRQAHLAKLFGVSRSTVTMLMSGRNWSRV